MKFSVVIHENYKELYRSQGMEFEKALALLKKLKGLTGYIEETNTVKHLPVKLLQQGNKL